MSELQLEEKMALLNQKRQKLAQSSSFEEIRDLWQEIKKLFADCSKTLEDVEKGVLKLDEQPNQIQKIPENFNFSEAMQELADIGKVKDMPVANLAKHIEKMRLLKNACLAVLEQEKANVLEIDGKKNVQENNPGNIEEEKSTEVKQETLL